MSYNKYILSPCGTSLLTNQAQDNEARKLVFKYSNEKEREDVPENDRVKLDELIRKISVMIDTADYQQAQKMSAELNGIIQICEGTVAFNNDFYFLLSTDTWLGEETAKLVEKWLKSKSQKISVLIHRQTDLQTKDMAAFQLSLSELVRKLDEELPKYSAAGYKIIFNLTGGFKSVQGFLQSIANFFADETVYIFETSSELMRIPRLPIKMDAVHIVEENIDFFRNLAMGLPTSSPAGIPETLLLTLDGETSFSPWGELIWTRSKPMIYEKALLVSPRPEKIRYGQTFTKAVAALPADRRRLINERVDQLNKHLADPGYNPPSLDFKALKGKPMRPSTHEMDAWSDKDARRIFAHFEDDRLVLDKLDQGLH